MKKKERKTKKVAIRDLKPKKASAVKGGVSTRKPLPFDPENG